MKARTEQKSGKTSYEIQVEQDSKDKWFQAFSLLAHSKLDDARRNTEHMVTKTKDDMAKKLVRDVETVINFVHEIFLLSKCYLMKADQFRKVEEMLRLSEKHLQRLEENINFGINFDENNHTQTN